MNLDLYYYFYYVCEFESVTKAANYLYVSQPAITKQIRNLERRLEKKLVERSANGIKLTNDGKKLYAEIKNSIEILNSVEASFKEKSDKYNQTIRIVADNTSTKIFLLNAFKYFQEIHPSISFSVKFAPYPEAIQLLREGKIDFMFLTFEEVKEKYNNIVMEDFMEVHDIFVVSHELNKKISNNISLLDLNNYPVICLFDNAISRKYLNDCFIKSNMEFKPKYELSNNWLIEEYVKMSLGMGILVKEHIQDKLDNEEFFEIKVNPSIPPRRMGYAYKSDAVNYQVVKEFISIIKKMNNIK